MRFLGYFTVSSGNFVSTFQDSMLVPSSRFNNKEIIIFKGGYNVILLFGNAVCEITVMQNKWIIIRTVSELHDFTS